MMSIIAAYLTTETIGRRTELSNLILLAAAHFFIKRTSMPRPPKFIHPFRRVREMIGLSQERASGLLGISTSTLKQIERGVLPLSEEIRSRILLLTGAKLHGGFCRKSSEPVAWDNSPYDAESLGKWRAQVFPQDASNADRFISTLFDDLHALIYSASRKGCLFTFLWAIQTALGDQARNFGLGRSEFLEDETLSRLFGNLLDRTQANGINLLEEFKIAQPVKSARGSKKRRS
jgi:transcriptional regulator with XRE-family HTH domain